MVTVESVAKTHLFAQAPNCPFHSVTVLISFSILLQPNLYLILLVRAWSELFIVQKRSVYNIGVNLCL